MYGIAYLIDGAVEVLPLRAHLHVSLVNAVGGARELQMRPHPLVDLRRGALHPSLDGCMIYGKATLPHHLLEVAVRELIPAIPSDTKKDDCRLEVPPLERGFILLQGYDSERGI